MQTRTFRVPLMVALLSGTASLALAQENPMVGGAAMFADRTIVENAVNSADHTTLVAAVQAAGLVETLSGPGPFTVFAPTNEAFAALPAGTVDTLLLPENKDMLTKVLTCHVVGADVMSDMLGQMIVDDGGTHPVPTLGGCVLQAQRQGDAITLTDENGTVATVTIADVDQSNGVIHVIDAVMTPAAAGTEDAAMADDAMAGDAMAADAMAAEPMADDAMAMDGMAMMDMAAPDPLPIYFSSGSARIGPEQQDVLDQAVRTFREGGWIVLVVAGGADTVGDPEANLDLSLRRARAVADGLVARGVSIGQLQVLGRGNSELEVSTADNVAEEGNRVAVITWR